MKALISSAAFSIFASFASPLLAEVKVSAIFSDHMVLQAGMQAPVWGTAAANEKVTVTVAGQSQTTQANAQGKWSVKLADLKAGTATTLVIEGSNKIEIQDVLVGEVWLGSGQSNMAMQVNVARDFANETAAAKFPKIRMFREISTGSESLQSECKGKWMVCSPENVGAFSAVLYYFGREIHRSLEVPVGLINSSAPGSAIESWIAIDAQRSDPALRPYLSLLDKQPELAKEPESTIDIPEPPTGSTRQAAQQAARQAAQRAAAQAARKDKAQKKPTDRASSTEEKVQRDGGLGGLFNAKISPLIPFAIRGVLWYQGEANCAPKGAVFYQHQLPLLVKDWRARWGHDFPIAWVQLPNYDGTGRDWPTVREAMLKTLDLPDTGMAVTIDIGEKNDIHPKNKQEVGRRLSLWALGKVYGKDVPATSGPLPDGHEIRGKEIAVKFSNAESGLKQQGQNLLGFMIAGSDRKWRPAVGRIDGNEVIVSNPDVSAPIAVRYAWDNYPFCNLYNGAGLPASPFRTDDWTR